MGSETNNTKNINLEVPKHTLLLAYLQLAKEQMEKTFLYTKEETTDNKGNKIANPLFEFYTLVKKHVANTECFIKVNYAGCFCLKCGIKVEGVLYCVKCDAILQNNGEKQIKLHRDFRNINLGSNI